jgi:hypothetical protein
MNGPGAKEIYRLLADLCEDLGFSMAVRDLPRFEKLVEHGPEVFADAVLAAEGIRPDEEKQMRREIRAFVAARFAHWEEGVDG